MIVVGDINLNLLNNNSTTKQFIDALALNGYCILNKIDTKFATRVAERTTNSAVTTTRTVIDHFFFWPHWLLILSLANELSYLWSQTGYFVIW